MSNQSLIRFAATTLAVLVAIAGSSASPLAGQQTGTLDLTLTLVTPTPTCSATVDAVDLGQFDTGTFIGPSPTQVPFNLNVSCTGAVAAATATFDGGQNPGAGSALRRLSNGGGKIIGYTLFDATTTLSIFAGAPITFPLAAGLQTVPLAASLVGFVALPLVTGTYTDQVTVTFTF